MTKKSTDATLAEIVANAVSTAHHFTCTIQRETQYQTYRFKTLAKARAYRPTLEAEANNSRRAMVYAVTHDAMTHLVPDSFTPAN